MSVAASSALIEELVEIFESAGVLNLQWKPIGIWVEVADGYEGVAGLAMAVLLEELQALSTTHDKRLFFGHFCEALEAAHCMPFDGEE